MKKNIAIFLHSRTNSCILEEKNDNEQFVITNCCHTTVHAECIMLLSALTITL